MRLPGFIGGLLLAALPLPGAAQTAPPPRPARDSAYAVHQLFRQHRRSAEGVLGLGTASIADLVFSAARGRSGGASVNVLLTVACATLGLREGLRYGPDREGSIVRQYEQGWPLPAEVRRRLRPKHFRAVP